jgi:rhomboid protease GluP
MFKRQKTGSVLCSSCGKLVGVRDDICWNCGRRNPGLWGFASGLRRLGYDLGFAPIVMGACGFLYVLSLALDPRGIRNEGISFLAPSVRSLISLGASGAIPVFGLGRWWTVLSAGWLHGNLLHIVFNLMWVRQLAPAAAELYGGPRMAIIYTLSSAVGFLLSSWAGFFFGSVPVLGGAAFTVGASAPIFGLLGALVVYGRRGGSSHISGQALSYAVIMFVFGLVMPGIDNYAHLGGFLGGYAVARWLDPLRPEKIAHVIAALALLAVSGAAILFSLLSRLAL